MGPTYELHGFDINWGANVWETYLGWYLRYFWVQLMNKTGFDKMLDRDIWADIWDIFGSNLWIHVWLRYLGCISISLRELLSISREPQNFDKVEMYSGSLCSQPHVPTDWTKKIDSFPVPCLFITFKDLAAREGGFLKGAQKIGSILYKVLSCRPKYCILEL